MIEQEFVPYEEALALKELGFDELCLGYYTIYSDGEVKFFTSDKGFRNLEAPTFSQAFRFFRYCYQYYASISPSVDLGNVDFTIEISQFLEDRYIGEGDNEEYFPRVLQLVHSERLDSYPEAELASLRRLIELANEKHTDSTGIS